MRMFTRKMIKSNLWLNNFPWQKENLLHKVKCTRELVIYTRIISYDPKKSEGVESIITSLSVETNTASHGCCISKKNIGSKLYRNLSHRNAVSWLTMLKLNWNSRQQPYVNILLIVLWQRQYHATKCNIIVPYHKDDSELLLAQLLMYDISPF